MRTLSMLVKKESRCSVGETFIGSGASVDGRAKCKKDHGNGGARLQTFLFGEGVSYDDWSGFKLH